MPVPDDTTLSKRRGDLDMEIQGSEALKASEAGPEEKNVHLVIDPTGLKVYGEEKWKQRIHGKQKRRRDESLPSEKRFEVASRPGVSLWPKHSST